MEELKSAMIAFATTYLTETEEIVPSNGFLTLLVEFCLEKYIERRNFPDYFTEAQILTDITKRKNTISMAVIDIHSKVGGEGETSHNENGTNRSFENAYISLNVFRDIIPYCNLF